jgi:hypothetical protein
MRRLITFLACSLTVLALVAFVPGCAEEPVQGPVVPAERGPMDEPHYLRIADQTDLILYFRTNLTAKVPKDKLSVSGEPPLTNSYNFDTKDTDIVTFDANRFLKATFHVTKKRADDKWRGSGELTVTLNTTSPPTKVTKINALAE